MHLHISVWLILQKFAKMFKKMKNWYQNKKKNIFKNQ